MLDHPRPPRANWGKPVPPAKPVFEKHLRLFVAGAVSTELFGRAPGKWWNNDRERALEYAKWLEGEDRRRQTKRMWETKSFVRAAFLLSAHLAALEALASALLSEHVLSRRRLLEILLRSLPATE